MDAKEFLNQATVLNEKINMDFLHLQKLRQMLERLGGSGLQCEHVQGGELPNSPATKIVDQIADLETEIDRELAEYEVVLEQIKEAIASCRNSDEIKILTGRYLEDKTIADLCIDMNIPESTAYTLHSRAIKKVKDFIKKEI